MAYSTSNPPALLLSQLGGTFKVFFYSSTDAATVVDTSSYFSDGQNHGMSVNDLVLVRDTTNNRITGHLVQSLSTATKGVDLGNGTTIATSTTDSD